MQHAILNFLCASLVPELCSNITAGSSGNAHLVLVAVAAVRALPDQLAVLVLFNLDLSVISANITEIALGIQLCVHDVVIDKLHNRENCRNVLLHVRNFHVADGTSRGKLLEFGFEFQLGECQSPR